MLNVLLISDEIIKDRTAIHGNIDAQMIYPDIKVAQDMYILPILGTALYNRLQALITAGDWTDAGDYKTLLDDYIIDALMYHTLAELPTTMGFQFWNKGIVRKNGLDTELPSMSDLVDIANKYRGRGEWYCKRLISYLKQNRGLFTEYLNPGNGIDTIHPEQSSFTLPIYLGPDDSCTDYGLTKPYSG